MTIAGLDIYSIKVPAAWCLTVPTKKKSGAFKGLKEGQMEQKSALVGANAMHPTVLLQFLHTHTLQMYPHTKESVFLCAKTSLLIIKGSYITSIIKYSRIKAHRLGNIRLIYSI